MTTVLVASTGGHLAELVELESRMRLADDCLWVTFDSPQSRSLLQGRSTRFIGMICQREFKAVCRGVLDAHRILAGTRATAVISTGAAVALSFLPYAALRGIPTHFIESATRVGSPSLTGRILERLPSVRLYRQYPEPVSGRWKYVGSVFDGFEAREARHREIRRVVVTLGSTGFHSFRRLLDRLVAILPKDVDVLWQTGGTPVDGLPIAAQPIVPAATLEQAIHEADVVIAHAGCGSALSALNAGKYPILVPREPQYGELVDRHQIELATWLGRNDLALHRSPPTLTFEAIATAAARTVRRNPNPPAFILA